MRSCSYRCYSGTGTRPHSFHTRSGGCVDVREPYEYCGVRGHIPGALNYPWTSGVLRARYEELPKDGPILVVCQSGGRSNAAASFLDSNGFTMVYDMLRGMSVWQWETAPCKYSGGSGTATNPYQIATADDLIALGETPEDYDKHFILTTDIDLDPNLPGRKVFDRAVIAPTIHSCPGCSSGSALAGIFDGNGHTISHLTIVGNDFLGLFGSLDSGSEVKDLGLLDVNITGSGNYIGGLVGSNWGTVTRCYSTGTVNSTCQISGSGGVGGLAGSNGSTVAQCYSTAAISGKHYVGGLVGYNYGLVVQCYSIGAVSGTEWCVGGLVGLNEDDVLRSVWDMKTSGLSVSAGGVGLTTAEMMNPYMLGLNGFGNDPNWVLDPGWDYPRLAWERTPGGIIPEPNIDWLEGQGTPEKPYRIDTASQLILLGKAGILCEKHIILGADIDLDPNLPEGLVFAQAVIPGFVGVFDGNDHTISHLTIRGTGYLGLFGYLASESEVKNLGVVDVNITGSGSDIGALVGSTNGVLTGVTIWGSSVSNSYSTGTVSGTYGVGGLVGNNDGNVTGCYSTCAVSGTSLVGGLVGFSAGDVTQCYSTGATSGNDDVGGLIGSTSFGSVTQCYSSGVVGGHNGVGGLLGATSISVISNCYSVASVSGCNRVGGLVGLDYEVGELISVRGYHLSRCYSAGLVVGENEVGGLLGHFEGREGELPAFDGLWDIETSGQSTSAAGTGKTTAEMQTASTFLEAGWDFAGETANGTEDIWWILEGLDYPRLWWEDNDNLLFNIEY
ncbi:MAG: rhodanese-like domain-containing protein [Planctomycetota bacterium]